jgi:hypothetical protein
MNTLSPQRWIRGIAGAFDSFALVAGNGMGLELRACSSVLREVAPLFPEDASADALMRSVRLVRATRRLAKVRGADDAAVTIDMVAENPDYEVRRRPPSQPPPPPNDDGEP